jgi:hypothetical protein
MELYNEIQIVKEIGYLVIMLLILIFVCREVQRVELPVFW